MLRNVKNLWFLNTRDFAKQNARCFREKISRTLSDNKHAHKQDSHFRIANPINKKAKLGNEISSNVLWIFFIIIAAAAILTILIKKLLS